MIMRTLFLALTLSLSCSANAALHERLGGAAFYDDVNGLTWASSLLLTAGTTFDNGPDTNDGLISYDSAMNWVQQLAIGGITNWRLPRIYNSEVINNLDPNSEVSSLVYGTLGNDPNNVPSLNLAPLFGPGIHRGNTPFSFIWNEDIYTGPVGDQSVLTVEGWLVREPNSIWPQELAWGSSLEYALQGPAHTASQYGYALAVQSGDVGTVPLPAATWLFGSALLGLSVPRRRT